MTDGDDDPEAGNTSGARNGTEESASAGAQGGRRRAERPPTLAIFPLPGVLLLPGGKLPLNIFEPRYLQMVEDAMAGHRTIGMVQPVDAAGGGRAARPEVYPVGGAGRITSFNETGDGRYLITLTGVTRFRIVEELSVTTGYRQVVADYAGFDGDLAPAEEGEVDGKRLLAALRAYLTATGIPADWESINRAPLPTLVTSLAMICPFSPGEKQALLEAPDAAERARTLVALMEMAALDGGGNGEGAPPARPN